MPTFNFWERQKFVHVHIYVALNSFILNATLETKFYIHGSLSSSNTWTSLSFSPLNLCTGQEQKIL